MIQNQINHAIIYANNNKLITKTLNYTKIN